MKFTNNQFTEIAFLFERANGNIHSDYEKNIIEESDLKGMNLSYLEEQIVDGLNSSLYTDSALRTSAYWALSKLHKPKLIPSFRKIFGLGLNLTIRKQEPFSN